MLAAGPSPGPLWVLCWDSAVTAQKRVNCVGRSMLDILHLPFSGQTSWSRSTAAPQHLSRCAAAVVAEAATAAGRSAFTARPVDAWEGMEHKDTDNALWTLQLKVYGQECRWLSEANNPLHSRVPSLGLSPGFRGTMPAVGTIFPSPHFCSLKWKCKGERGFNSLNHNEVNKGAEI